MNAPRPPFAPSAEQSAVIQHQGGHALVGAVAGSGKSQTLVERVAKLVENGCAYDRLLVLMFNVAAAEEFSRRLALRMPHLPNPQVMTFHAYGQALCRQLERIGLLVPAYLLDEAQAQPLGREVLEYVNQHREASQRIEITGEAVEDFLSAMDVLKGALYDGQHLPPMLKESLSPLHVAAYPVFEQFRGRKRIRLFGDLVSDPVRAAHIDERIRRVLANRFDHIVIDEFQDINEAQMALVRLLAGESAHVMGVGDEDQTIYTWRGARPDYMVSLFEREFPGTRRYALTRTFRYGHTLSLLANSVIVNNPARTDKICISASSCPNTQIAVRMHPDGGGSGPIVAEEVQRWVAEGRKHNEIAVLVRQFASAVPIEIALREKSIPFHLVGAPSFVAWPEVLSLHLPLILAAAKGKFPSHWSAAQRAALLRAAFSVPSLYLRRDEMTSLAGQIAQHAVVTPELVRRALQTSCTTRSYALTGVRAQMLSMLEWAYDQRPDADAETLLRDAIRMNGLLGWIAKSGASHEYREARLRMVRSVVRYAHGHTARSLHETFCDIDRASVAPDAAGGVLITSIHRAKGLEWPTVILPELAEGVFPASEADIEDERRLFYVAATRAREQLVMVCPFDRDLVGWARAEKEGYPAGGAMRASRFLYEANLMRAQRIGGALSASAAFGSAIRQATPTLPALLERYIAAI
ncbi:MAG: DNA helicase II / ATP-dependent DNA helicase PcrA [Azoarcus sp.]|nr:DNA helicase II / ATP-dependent DNA helicase PcrA [Azoarcus sp.]